MVIMPTKVDRIWRNGRIATLRSGTKDYGMIDRGSIATRAGRIVWVGTDGELPALNCDDVIDLEGRLVTPGLIDCHTHMVYAGNRAQEFEDRLNGQSYEDIARAGGGILSTVAATRAATTSELVAQSLPRLDSLLAEGVTTVEIKSGYGLDTEGEAMMLAAARRLGDLRDVRVRTSFLGAHALPPEADGNKDAYIENVCTEQLPAIAAAGLADAVDGFCDNIAFSPAQIRRVFTVAKSLDLPVRLHAEQLSNQGGAALAAEFGALSADHLEHLDEDGARALAAAGTVAVLLPGAFYFLRETKVPPVDLLRQHGVAIAVATDCNPGSSPLTSILSAMNMACTLFRLTPEEALAGVTRNAATALGLGEVTGTIEEGKSCDLAIWNVERPVDLIAALGFNPLYDRIWKGS